MANLGPNIVLNNPFAGVTDFGTVTDVFSGENETTETVRPATALEYIARNVDPAHPLYQALIGHSSTSITPYTDVNGNQFYHIAGKTGGPNRERYAQMYAVQGDQLIPVGEGQFYKGEHPDQAFKDFLGVAAGLIAAPVLGPYASAIGNALGITNAAIAQAVGQGIINTSVQVAQGVPIADALKQNIVASVIPNAVGNPIIDNAIRAAASARLMGGDVEKAVTNSLIASGVQSAASDVSITGDRTVDSGLVSGATSSLQAAVTGGDIGQSFIQGYVRGSSTAINQDEARAQRAASGAGFLGGYEDLSGAGPADYVMGERDPALVQAGFFDSARGLLQSSLAELGKSWLAAGQQVGIAPQTLQRAIDYLSVIEQGGQALIPEDIKAQQQAFISKIYGVASNPNSSATDIGRAVVEATIENPLGSLTLVGSEIMQELPTLLLPGGAIGKLASFALNIAESAGGQALEKIDELRRANPNMTNQQLIEAARADAGISGLVTAVASLLPGANTKALQPIVEGLKESLEEGITQYILTGDRNAATGSAILGGVIGGKTTGALQTGDQVAEAAQRTFAEVPSLGSITVSSTRLPLDQPFVTPGEPLAITPSVVTKQGATDNVPAPQLPTAVVISTDPTKDTALVIDSSGQTKIVGATDVATGTKVTEGQTFTITTDNKLTSDASKVTPTVTTKTIDTKETAPTVTDTKAVTPDSTIKISEGVRREPTTYTGDLQGQRGTGAARLDEFQRTFQGTLYPTVEARNKAMQDYYASLGIRTEPETTAPTDTFTVSKPVVRDDANLADVISKLGSLGFTPTNEVVSQLMAGNPTKAEVNQRIDAQTYNNRFYATAQEAANAKLKDDLIRVGNDLIGQGKSFEEVTSFLNGQLGALGLASGITMKNGRPEVMLVATQQVERRAAPDTNVQTDPALAEAKARIEDAKARAAANTARAEEQTRTFNGTVYPTVEARNQAAADFASFAGITPTERVASDVTENPPGAANLASVVNFLGQMGITPTQSMMDALMAGNPTNAEVLTRIRSNPEILAAVAARGQTQDTGTKVGPGGQVVTGGDVKVGGDLVTGGEIVQEQKPAEIDVANQPALQQDVVALLGRMGLPTSAAFVAELTRDNATNAQVLQRLQADPAVQALIRQQRFGQTDTAIVVAVNPTNNTALVIDTKGNTQTIEAVDTKTGQTLVEDQVITVPVVTETAQTFTFDPAASLIQTRFQENGKVATEQDIASLKAAAQQAGIDFTSDNFGTTPAYQRWATLVNDTAQGIKPYVAPTVTPEVKVDTGTKVIPSVTESIDLTFDPGRVNIDTPEDTVQAQDTFSFVDTTPAVDTTPVIDTTPTFDTVVDTLPQDTVPTYGEDEDIIKFLGLDQQPTPTEPEAPPAEDTIGGGTGTTNIIPEERLAVAPKAVYTPRPGTRVVDTGTSTGILPTRVQLSEGMGDDVEGTGEEEQQPVWNVRSLKLRRALGI
jgi:hypothetical protein